jgi:hypothetical protein
LGAKTFADFADAVRAALGGEAFASAWAEGRAMALEQAMIEHCRLLRHAEPASKGNPDPPMGTGDRAP